MLINTGYEIGVLRCGALPTELEHTRFEMVELRVSAQSGTSNSPLYERVVGKRRSRTKGEPPRLGYELAPEVME